MWTFTADENGELTFELQDEEGQIIELIKVENLRPKERVWVEMFAGNEERK